jgi:hypothetical protein
MVGFPHPTKTFSAHETKSVLGGILNSTLKISSEEEKRLFCFKTTLDFSKRYLTPGLLSGPLVV